MTQPEPTVEEQLAAAQALALLDTVQATTTEDGDVREVALRALARIGDPVAVPPLIEALKRAEGWLAPRIADILGRHGDLVVESLEGPGQGGSHPATPHDHHVHDMPPQANSAQNLPSISPSR